MERDQWIRGHGRRRQQALPRFSEIRAGHLVSQHARSRPVCTGAGRRFAIFNLYGRICTRTRRQAVGAIHKFKRKPRFLQQARIRGFPRM